MTRPLLDKLPLVAIAVLLTLQLSAAAYGVRLVRDVVGHARHQLEIVAQSERR
jgi:hypothetical protein